ncbi:hypothetical protein HO173_001758 [Letharia columbiana]|uniref:Peroxisomal membrane protein PEX13 n=1 Tax=Letharia columbiana TaxID=112416 RepID=A0A8H6L954_9LECA|nr:uncharacterized protein HO173_001758 [Letharia columbiana]KAF6240148.1 hypothetical protein HO173_001758 [Letharia columbiana]
MAAVSPPKPWERANAAATGVSSTSTPNPHTTTPITSSSPPALPDKPSSLASVVNRNSSTYSPINQNRFSSSPYSGVGSYSSPYSRFGGMGNSMYGGGYGSMYGGVGGMGGMGMGGYGGGMYGQPGMMGNGDPNDPNSLTNSFSQSTQATFQIIESLVGAFGGFAQMLESTYMATHSSFFAMVQVAEQFSTLRTTLGSILGIFTVLRWLRTLFAKVTGRPPPADATSLTPSAFASFQGLSPSGPSLLQNGQPTPSKKPFLIFLAAVIGLPYLMTKLIRSLARQNKEQQNLYNQEGRMILGPDGQPMQEQQPHQPIDPSKLDFCRLLYDYTPESMTQGGSPTEGIDLEVKKGDLVAVLSKSDPMGNPSDWWRCRARDGRVGYLPGLYLEGIQRKQQPQIDNGGRVNTMSSLAAAGSGEESRSNSLKVEAKGPKVESKAADISAESFQRSQFYN